MMKILKKKLLLFVLLLVLVVGGVLTGHRRETRRLVVAISLSGSAVNFSLTVGKKKKNKIITSKYHNINCSECEFDRQVNKHL